MSPYFRNSQSSNDRNIKKMQEKTPPPVLPIVPVAPIAPVAPVAPIKPVQEAEQKTPPTKPTAPIMQIPPQQNPEPYLPSKNAPMQQMYPMEPTQTPMDQMMPQNAFQVMPEMMPQNMFQVMPQMMPQMMPQNMPVCPYQGYPTMPSFGNMNDMDSSMPYLRDPQPVLSNNPPIIALSAFKELTGYPNYGNPSGNADILYTGNRGTWTLNIPAFLFVPGNETVQLVIRAVLDDHLNVPVARYSANITFNGSVIHSGPVPLEHGVPSGGRFTNWRNLTFNIPNLRRAGNRVTIVNTSSAGPNDWIGLDWMELRISPRR